MDNKNFVSKARKKVKEGLSIDDLIRKLIAFSDSLEKGENTLFEQLNDLYFLYYPEAANKLKERDVFIKELKEACNREDVSKKLGISIESMGYDLQDDEIQLLSLSINEINNISDLRKIVSERLSEIIKKNYPNLTAVLGSEITARMIYLAGSAYSLMLMPSSKIQVLGAEKAMFAARRKKATPKYGIIYNHELVISTPDKLKGKVSKVIAAYSSLAAKTDVLSKEDKSSKIIEKMMKDISKARTKNGT
ncbi:MAG: Pre-mRNA processing ribonucleoprotein, binding domain protein [Candidatus Parvarchaeum acidiphilum ARMAN-4]|uniref:Pre-mRNA processing ribonucleoprotein, binding domain protein n=1 Tax=Candidatus Parvarchaeum acidiphilum ARMAN-4 TaxID=662760 RepID=D2EEA9_PARA4|nr:MAG: Pre-mRNA processing ribonucleoprotein, binding domain protein [Candidatus Parvarchaeum acidiphilum ARMAN-4]